MILIVMDYIVLLEGEADIMAVVVVLMSILQVEVLPLFQDTRAAMQ